MAQGSKGAYHQACVLESDSWTLQVRLWSHTCQWHACLCIKTCSHSQIINKYCLKKTEEVTKTEPQNSQTARGNGERSYTGSLPLSHSKMCAKFWCSKQHGNQDIKNWYETMKQNRESGVDPSSYIHLALSKGTKSKHGKRQSWPQALLGQLHIHVQNNETTTLSHTGYKNKPKLTKNIKEWNSRLANMKCLGEKSKGNASGHLTQQGVCRGRPHSHGK